ncbi:MAG TPA: polysaccharide deacetylase family protein [Chitinophagaceae bacterium]|nr:polysaccharide deacetylase family protein [Chitinophagaceae bacterium]
MEFEAGKFVISLDFELFWGVRDKRTIENYGSNIAGVRQAMPAMLDLFDKYGVNVTFSTVGFLFAQNKAELKNYLPALKPAYTDQNLSPYAEVETIGENEHEDPYHFGYSLLASIANRKQHEIGTHTFCHYYCLEPGQTVEAFRQDLLAAKRIAAAKNISIRSLVFPRNQFNAEYLAVCKEAGIDAYRGNPVSGLYEARNKNDESLTRRALRIIDAYINIAGHHCHTKEYVLSSTIVNVAASRFLRPYSRKLSFLEGLRLRRIKKSMRHAAIHHKLFHLWWHPHNFGANLPQNLHFLEQVLAYYRQLNERYGFHSITMTGITNEAGRNE